MADATSATRSPPNADPAYANDVATVNRLDVVRSVLEVVCRTTGMGFAAVARVTEDRWIACAVRDEIGFGLRPGGELPVASTICNEIRQTGCLVAIDEVATDETFRDHPTATKYGLQSYISVPLRLPDGRLFGTLCAIDPRPARVNNVETIGMFQLFAELIGLHLDAQDRLDASEAALATARQRADLQNQFVAVLGHDLRNPLSAVQTATTILQGLGLDSDVSRLLAVIERSGARMARLIDDVLDFARSRLGDGLPVTLRDEPDLQGALDHVVSEMRTAQGDRDRHIDTDIVITRPVRCDPVRIGQLLSNLLSNALTHGRPGGAVRVYARADSGFELSVSNEGGPIDSETRARLFQPFARGADQGHSHGLGLGLYIAAQIARTHGGTLDVTSSPAGTRFTFRIAARAVESASPS